jgi:hypothetical protein
MVAMLVRRSYHPSSGKAKRCLLRCRVQAHLHQDLLSRARKAQEQGRHDSSEQMARHCHRCQAQIHKAIIIRRRMVTARLHRTTLLRRDSLARIGTNTSSGSLLLLFLLCRSMYSTSSSDIATTGVPFHQSRPLTLIHPHNRTHNPTRLFRLTSRNHNHTHATPIHKG